MSTFDVLRTRFSLWYSIVPRAPPYIPVSALMISLIFHELAILRSDSECVKAPDVAISGAPISDHILTFTI